MDRIFPGALLVATDLSDLSIPAAIYAADLARRTGAPIVLLHVMGRGPASSPRTRGGWLEPLARKVPVLWPLVWPIAALIDRGPGELLHHYMESGMLKGIKSRVEAAQAGEKPCR